jgi:2-dehydropantoate 2-reductase
MDKQNRAPVNNSSAPLNDGISIGIIGLGAIGCLFRSQIPSDINIYALPSDPALKEIDFQLDDQYQSTQYTTPVWQNETLDVVVVCCKATQCLAALSLWQKAINQDCQIVLLQNGMGQQELVAAQYPKNALFAASTTEGAYKKSPQHVVHAGQGITQWGYFSGGKLTQDSPLSLKLDINTLKGEHKWHHNIEEVLFAKLAVNAVINPLTVKHNCKNGILINDPIIYRELEALCEETQNLYTAMHWPLAFDLTERVKSIARLTAENVSSMLQDMRAMRETEIDFITGYLITKAQLIDYELPKHLPLFKSIKSSQA